MTNAKPQDQDTTPKIEIEVNPDTDFVADTQSLSEKAFQLLQNFQKWYGKLPGVAKIAVAIGVIFFSLSLLTKVLHLVTSLISVSILALVLYGLYRFFLKSNPSQES